MNRNKQWIAALLALGTAAGAALTAFAATEHWNDASRTPEAAVNTPAGFSDWEEWKAAWPEIATDFTQVSLTPGRDETQLNFGWYSAQQANPAQVRISESQQMEDAKIFSGSSVAGTAAGGSQYFTNKVTVTGLKPHTTYWYQVYAGGAWRKAAKYQTKSFREFSVLLVGDPQIGASVGQTPKEGADKQTAEYAARNDAFNWNKTLNAALAAHPETSFMISAGDQVNETVKDGSAAKLLQQEKEYAGYLSASALRSLPVATTIGNHDSRTAGYQNHFNNPNPFTSETGATAAGNGYYYTYGDALFIVLNTNNYNAADHRTLVAKAVNAHPDANWRIVTFHQDIYGSGLDHSDSDGMILRTQLTPIFDQYDIDVVLQGHDHTYSRTYQLTGDGKQHTAFDSSVDLDDEAVKTEFLSQNICYSVTGTQQGRVTDPEGVVYIATNSATGSKYYELIPQQQDYIAARNQNWTPSYSLMDITPNTFTIRTYNAESGQLLDRPYTIEKIQ